MILSCTCKRIVDRWCFYALCCALFYSKLFNLWCVLLHNFTRSPVTFCFLSKSHRYVLKCITNSQLIKGMLGSWCQHRAQTAFSTSRRSGACTCPETDSPLPESKTTCVDGNHSPNLLGSTNLMEYSIDMMNAMSAPSAIKHSYLWAYFIVNLLIDMLDLHKE